MASAGSKVVKAGIDELIDLIADYLASGKKIKKIPPGKRSMTESQMKKAVREEGKLIPENPRLKGEKAAARPSYLQRPAGKKRTQAGSQRGLSGEHRGLMEGPKGFVKTKKKKKKKKKSDTSWMSGLSSDEIKSILGITTVDPITGIRGHRKKGGQVIKKRHGGMTRVGLSPAEEARSGTMSEAKRARYMQAGGPIRTTFPRRADPRKGRAPAVDLFPEVGRKNSGVVVPKPKRKPRAKARVESYKRKKAAGKFGLSPSGKRTLKATGNVIKDVATDPMSLIPGGSTISLAKSLMKSKKKKGGKVGKKEQGYKARKDESIAMRVKKKRTPKQLKASRDESYGKPGTGKGKGKINRISSKQTDGNKLVAAIYD